MGREEASSAVEYWQDAGEVCRRDTEYWQTMWER